MKNIITLFFISFSISCFSQDFNTVIHNGNFTDKYFGILSPSDQNLQIINSTTNGSTIIYPSYIVLNNYTTPSSNLQIRTKPFTSSYTANFLDEDGSSGILYHDTQFPLKIGTTEFFRATNSLCALYTGSGEVAGFHRISSNGFMLLRSGYNNFRLDAQNITHNIHASIENVSGMDLKVDIRIHGNGIPSMVAPIGAFYVNDLGGLGTTIYYNYNGTTSGWVAL